MQHSAGLVVPLVSAFTDDSFLVSEVRIARIVRWYLEAGAKGFVVCSDIGEFWSLDSGERKTVLEIVVRETHGRADVYCNVSSLSTRNSLDLAQHAYRHGAKAAVMMPPYYGSPTGEEIVAHFNTVAHHGELEVIAVDRMGVVGEDLHARLSHVPRVTMAKTLMGTTFEGLAVRQRPATDEFLLDDAICTPIASLMPEKCVASLGGTPFAAAPIARLIHQAGALRVIKAALELMDREVGPPRNPINPLNQTFAAVLRELLKAF